MRNTGPDSSARGLSPVFTDNPERKKLMYIRVCVDIPTDKHETFVYRVPEMFTDVVAVGSRVFVEFGFQKTLAYVLELLDEVDYAGVIKDIIDILDIEDGLNPEQTELAAALSADTKAPLSVCLSLMYPAFLQSRLRYYLILKKPDELDKAVLSLFAGKKRIQLTNKELPFYKKLRQEAALGHLEIVPDIHKYGSRKIIKAYKLIKEEAAGPKQQLVVAYLRGKGSVVIDEIKENTGVSAALLNRMAERGILAMIPAYPELTPTIPKMTPISSFGFDEKQVVDKYYRLENKPFLLFTDNDDFRLRFLIDAAQKTIANKKTVLIVTPTLLINTFLENYFTGNLSGGRVCSFTSALPRGNFYYNYRNVIKGNADVVIATATGVFLPLQNIGLIILIHEEHHGYISEQYPHFSVLEVLKYRAAYHKAKLILSTASPSVATYYEYNRARYYLLEHITGEQKSARLVNVREEPSDLMLSSVLREEITKCLAANTPAMLVLNNLGYSSANICEECGNFLKCPKCKIGLVYYKDKNMYRCRYCNGQYEDMACEECGSRRIKHVGYGLERLAERLQYYYPEARIYRVSSLTMQSARDYDDFFLALEENTADIIIGTATLLDMMSSDIGLLALINADAVLFADDYRAAEMCYNMVSKAVNFRKAATIIQGYNTDHYAITQAAAGNYRAFYETEIIRRGYASYPPFGEVNKLAVTGDYKEIYHFANYFKKVFNRFKKGDCLGPVYTAKQRGIRLIIKHNDFIFLSRLIDEVTEKFKDRNVKVSFERHVRFYD